MHSEPIRVHSPPGVVRVSLPEPGNLGYRWRVVEVPPDLEALGDAWEAEARTFLLRCPNAGRYTVRFLLARPWEDEGIASRTAEIQVG